MKDLPRWARWAVRLLPRRDREVVLGDLREEFDGLVDERGGRAARRWLRGMVLRTVVGSRLGWVRNRLEGIRPPVGMGIRGRDGRERGETMREVMQDVRRSLRSLARTPGFAFTVIATIALGVGATTAIYTVAHGVLLSPLPYPNADRVVFIQEEIEEGQIPVTLSYPTASDFRDGQTTLEAMAVTRGGALTLTGTDRAENLNTLFVDPEYLEILGATPILGRLLGPGDNLVPSQHPVAVISQRLWEERFDADPNVIGSSIGLGGRPHTVIGVLGEDHQEPFASGNDNQVALWLPAMMASMIDSRGDEVLTNRRTRTFSALARMRPGVTPEEAEADLDRVARGIEELFPEINEGMGAYVESLQEQVAGNLSGPVRVLLAGAGVLLLIGCFNVANLLLVRGASKEQEMAVQLALGAGRGRLFRRAIVESLVLALSGGVAGILIATSVLPALLRMLPQALPPTAEVGVDAPVLLVAILVSIVAGLVFGLLPAVRVSGIELRGPMSGSRGTVGDRAGERARSGLVLMEIATATVLLTATGLLVQSFRAMTSVDPGFQTDEVMAITVNFAQSRYPGDLELAQAIRELREQVADMPGVDWAHPWGSGRPGASFNYQTTIPDGMFVERITDSPLARRHQVGPGTLDALGISIVQGRDFDATDVVGTRNVAIVSAKMAADRWPGEDPIGKRLVGFHPPGTEPTPDRVWWVVGVAEDAQHEGRIPQTNGLTSEFDIYYPQAQRPDRTLTYLIHGPSNPTVQDVAQVIQGYDPDIPVVGSFTMEQALAAEEAPARFSALLMAFFGVAALLLAALGVYGVLSFAVSQRTREIGLRTALGADAGSTLRHFVVRGVRLAAIGVVAGLIASGILGRVAESFLPAAPPMDFGVLGLAGGLLLLVSTLACLLPALRATRIAPSIALKE